MTEKRPAESDRKRLRDADIDRMLQVLSLEYQTLREDILVRTSGRFQFLGFTTTAAALLASGILGHSIFGEQTWIAATLAAGVFVFGLVCFWQLGRQMVDASALVAQIEQRINALVPSESEHHPLLSLETGRQQHDFIGKITLGVIPHWRSRTPSDKAGQPDSQKRLSSSDQL
jgi:hypothetical protein